MSEEEQKELSLKLFQMARELANEIGHAWDDFYKGNEDVSKYWMPLEILTLSVFFRRHVEYVMRRKDENGFDTEVLRQHWYSQLELFSQAGHEVVHAALTGRLEQLDEWRVDIDSEEASKVCSRDRLFPNKPVPDSEWELLKRGLQ